MSLFTFKGMVASMELLTDRLSLVIKEMADNLMAQLIIKHNSECLRMTKQDVEDLMFCDKATTLKLIEDQKRKENLESERQNRIASMSSIWGASRHLKSNTPNPGNKEANKKRNNKFLKAARLLIVMNLLKQGCNICTCDSLDSKCKRHDS